jgi:hypothetical protein
MSPPYIVEQDGKAVIRKGRLAILDKHRTVKQAKVLVELLAPEKHYTLIKVKEEANKLRGK